MIYRHNKTGRLYSLIARAIDATNDRGGIGAVVYRNADRELPVFVREEAEFDEKFTVVAEAKAGGDGGGG